MARELERRISTIRDVRSDIDARLFDTPEKIERGWLTLRTAQRLYSAFDPSRASN